jgi:hypothetical protein
MYLFYVLRTALRWEDIMVGVLQCHMGTTSNNSMDYIQNLSEKFIPLSAS